MKGDGVKGFPVAEFARIWTNSAVRQTKPNSGEFGYLWRGRLRRRNVGEKSFTLSSDEVSQEKATCRPCPLGLLLRWRLLAP